MDNKLTIRNMTQDQAGWYQCLASDGSNRALSRKTKLNLVCKFFPALLFGLLILATSWFDSNFYYDMTDSNNFARRKIGTD